MRLASQKVFDFVSIQGEHQSQESLDGDFFIMNGEQCIGELSVCSTYGRCSVSAETPDINLTIQEWLVFMESIQERFNLEDSQEVMINRYPSSVGQLA